MKKSKRVFKQIVAAVAAICLAVGSYTYTPAADTYQAETGGVQYETLAAAITACASGGTVKVLADLDLDTDIKIKKPVKLDLQGHTITLKTSSSTAINIYQGTEGTSIENGKFTADGSVSRALYINKTSVDFKDLVFDGLGSETTSYDGGAIYIGAGTGATFNFENCTFQNCKGKSGGAIYASGDETTLTLKECTFQNNEALRDTKNSSWYGGGDVYVGTKVNLTVDKSLFKNSYAKSCAGSIYLFGAGDVSITDSVFDGCRSDDVGGKHGDASTNGGGAGAIFVRATKNAVIDGNEIKNCSTKGKGGGIVIFVADTDLNDSVSVLLRDNYIHHNSAEDRGGGLYIGQLPYYGQTVKIESGRFEYNKAAWGGGIDYTTHNQPLLQLDDIIVTENSALRGGGIWICPYGSLESHSTMGGAIFENKATEVDAGTAQYLPPSGDDVRYEGADAEKTDPVIWTGYDPDTHMTLINRTLGGGWITWYQDEIGDRYEEGDAPASQSIYTKTQKSFGLHAEMPEHDQKAAWAEAKIIVKGNMATYRGGGIAANSPVVMGAGDADVSIAVKKVWEKAEGEDEKLPDSLTVDVWRTDAEGNSERLDHNRVLSEKNNWSATFVDLPAYYQDENGYDQKYSYTVKERTISGWSWQASTETQGEGTRDLDITITNSDVTYEKENPPGDSDKETKKVKKVPVDVKTSDFMNPMLWIVLSLLALAAIFAVRKRRES